MRLLDGAANVGDGVPAAGGAAEAPESAPVEAQPVTETPNEAPVESNASPWDADLRAALEGADDPIAAASEFIGKNIQPRVTQLEQDLAGRSEVPAEVQELYEDLKTDPDQVVAALLQARFGDEKAQEALALLTPQELEEGIEDLDAQLELDDLPEDVKNLVQKQKEQEEKEAWEALVEDIKGQEKYADLDEVNFAKHLMVSGNVEQALAAYDAEQAQFEAAFKEKYGITDEQPPAPPNTINSETPVQPDLPKQYTKWEDLDDAFDDMAAETRPAPPPAVGTV